MKSSIYWISGLVLLVWMAELANMSQGHRLDEWGILPRTSKGLIGIPLSPFLHGGFDHVLSNTLPFVFLGGVVMMRGRTALFQAVHVDRVLEWSAPVDAWPVILPYRSKHANLRVFRLSAGPRMVRAHPGFGRDRAGRPSDLRRSTVGPVGRRRRRSHGRAISSDSLRGSSGRVWPGRARGTPRHRPALVEGFLAGPFQSPIVS